MFSIAIDQSAFERIVARTVEALEFGVRDSVRNAADAGVAEAKRSGRFKNRTGFLRSNIVARFIRSNGRSAQWEILSAAPYSTFIEKGTRPHEIWPKARYGMKGPLRNDQTRRASGRGPHEHVVGRGSVLRWVGSDGQTHFAAMVHHPGTKPDPFMAPAFYRANRVILRELDAMIAKAAHLWN